jgi:drug/metabolite transporter, DME family
VARSLFDEGVDPLHLAEARAVVAFVGLTITRRTAKRARGAPPMVLAVLGGALAGVTLTYYVAIQHLPVAVAIVLQYTAPALVVVWTALRDRRVPSRDVGIALATSVVGVALVSGALGLGTVAVDWLGVTMGLASAGFFAAYTLAGERASADLGALGATRKAFGVAALLWILYQVPDELPEDVLMMDRLPAVLFVGVAGTLVPFLLYIWAVDRIGPASSAITATLEPVLAGVVAWIFLGQSLSAAQIVGGALVLSGVVTLYRGRKEEPR